MLALHTACTFRPVHDSERQKQLHALYLTACILLPRFIAVPKKLSKKQHKITNLHPFRIDFQPCQKSTACGREHTHNKRRPRIITDRPKHRFGNTFTPPENTLLPLYLKQSVMKNNRLTKKHALAFDCYVCSSSGVALPPWLGGPSFIRLFSLQRESDRRDRDSSSSGRDMKNQQKNATHAIEHISTSQKTNTSTANRLSSKPRSRNQHVGRCGRPVNERNEMPRWTRPHLTT